MKIIFLSMYSGIVARGAETYVHELASKLGSNLNVFVYQAGTPILNQRYKTVQIGMNASFSNSQAPNLIKRKLYLDYYSKVIHKFTQKALQQIDLAKGDVIIPVNNGWQTFLSCQVAKKHGAKVIVSSQSGIGRWGPGYDEFINTLWGVDCYVALTNTAKRRLSIFAPWQRAIVIPNGVDLEKFNSNVKPVKLELNHPIILCVSALNAWKRVHLTIEAVAKMKANASLLVVGKGNKEETQFIQSMGNELLGRRFVLTNSLYSQIQKYYAACDLFTLASESTEAFGIVYLEAMAANKPVVATDDSQRREILQDAALYINPKNTNSYAEALDKALVTNWGDTPRVQADKYKWEGIAQRYVDLFNSL
jgi:glycosyltransferase involved in cell wall biosynthesis